MLNKIIVTLAAILALGATSAMAGGNDCPLAHPVPVVVVPINAYSLAAAGGAVGTFAETGNAKSVNSGARDTSTASFQGNNNKITTFTSSKGGAYTNSLTNAGAEYFGVAQSGSVWKISTPSFPTPAN